MKKDIIDITDLKFNILERRGFRINKRIINQTWRVLNFKIFDIMIPFPRKYVIKRFKSTLIGYIEYDEEVPENWITLGLQEIFPDRLMFTNVLVHEMIHAYQLIKFDLHVEDHGDTFWEWKDKVNATGLTLQEHFDWK